MHYEKKYTKPSPEENREKALCDIADWLGVEHSQFKSILAMGILAGWAKSSDQLALPYSFTGIQGFPVHACWEYAQELLNKPQ